MPTRKENELLSEINRSGKIISGKEKVNEIRDKYLEEIERLIDYGIIEITEDDGIEYRIKITPRGSLILSKYF